MNGVPRWRPRKSRVANIRSTNLQNYFDARASPFIGEPSGVEGDGLSGANGLISGRRHRRVCGGKRRAGRKRAVSDVFSRFYPWLIKDARLRRLVDDHGRRRAVRDRDARGAAAGHGRRRSDLPAEAARAHGLSVSKGSVFTLFAWGDERSRARTQRPLHFRESALPQVAVPGRCASQIASAHACRRPRGACSRGSTKPARRSSHRNNTAPDWLYSTSLHSCRRCHAYLHLQASTRRKMAKLALTRSSLATKTLSKNQQWLA